MGYDALDRAILGALWRLREHAPADDLRARAAGALRDRHTALDRPLRSWSLVLRATDSRLACEMRERDAGRELVVLGRGLVERLCSPVMIDWPGVCVREAADRFGVSTVTIWRWAKAGLIQRWVDENRADRKRDAVRFWTRVPFDVSMRVNTHGPWGSVRRGLVRHVPEDFEQRLEWERDTNDRGEPGRWVCPGCGRFVERMYWPVRFWTVLAHLAGEMLELGDRMVGEGFSCRRCAGLWYESNEGSWGRLRVGEEGGGDMGITKCKGRSRAIAWDRFVRRLTGGLLRGDEVVVG
ncbi:MAG: hypothetical protein GC164_13950 [Phycisphaera sp.]|nr:hypothetical protein [Phycisphaera sp.]